MPEPIKPAPTKSRSFSKWIATALFVLVILPAAGLAIYIYATLTIAYSTGERVGYIQKISKKGWVCKTWEGELAMVTMPGTPPQLFQFSVRDEAVARKLLDAAGKRVALSYEQHRGVPSQCFGETEYFIGAVRLVE